jgi:hypothetical protein
VNDVTNVFVCLVDADRDPFVLIRTKEPFNPLTVLSKMELEKGPQSPINGLDYQVFKKNPPVVDAVARGLSSEALLGEAGMPVTEEDKKRWKEKPYGLFMFDNQTLVIGEVNILERYLSDLENGQPKFLTDVAPADAPPPPAPGGEGGSPGSPAPEGGRPKLAPEGGPPGPMGGRPGGGGGRTQPKEFTTVPTYRTVDRDLKQILNRLESDDKNPPALVFADMIDQRVYDRDFRSLYAGVGALVQNLLAKDAKIFGLSIGQFAKEKFTANLAFKYVSGEDAKNSIDNSILPLLNALKSVLAVGLGTNVNVNSSGGGGNRGGPGGFGGPPGEGGVAAEGGGPTGSPGGAARAPPAGGRAGRAGSAAGSAGTTPSRSPPSTSPRATPWSAWTSSWPGTPTGTSRSSSPPCSGWPSS